MVSRVIASLRALLSLLMLAGFYVVALVQFLVVLLFAYLLSTLLPGHIHFYLTLPMIIVAGGSVVAALWAALRSRHEPMTGVVISAQPAAPLWTMVRELASLAHTRIPDEIRIVAEVNAAVSEDTRFLGLLPGKRYLYLGLPLLQSLSSRQIRAIVAHELGHYSHAHTRLASIAYRGRHAISGTISRIHPRDPVGWVFRAYYLLYLLVDRSVSRRQEFQADEHAVRAAGKEATVNSLTEVGVLAAAFHHFIRTQVSPRAEYGYLPDDLFGSFAAFLTERDADLAALRQTVVSRGGSIWGTHPAMSERVLAIERLAEPILGLDAPADVALVEGLEKCAPQLASQVLPHSNCRLLPWQDFVSVTSSAQLQAEADLILRAVRRRLGQDNVDLQQVFDLIEQGEKEQADQLPMLLGLAALRSGVARWQASWTGPATLVDDNREPLPLNALARLARKPGGTALLIDRLHKLGIEANAASL